MIALLVVIVITAGVSSSEPPHECRGSAIAPALSHVVVSVDDMEAASAQFRELGFRLKQGRLHPNNLLNRHIKFRDGSGIELMAVQGEPGDALAGRYTTLAANGGGGVYVALDVLSPVEPERAAATLRLEVQRSTSGSWQFVSFPDSSPAAAVFFAAGVPVVIDPDSLVAHAPDVSGLTEAWLEGGSELIALLEVLGAKRCGTISTPDGHTGERLGLRRGHVVIVPARPNSRPRVLGAVLRLRAPGDAVVWPQPHFWVRYRFDRSWPKVCRFPGLIDDDLHIARPCSVAERTCSRAGRVGRGAGQACSLLYPRRYAWSASTAAAGSSSGPHEQELEGMIR